MSNTSDKRRDEDKARVVECLSALQPYQWVWLLEGARKTVIDGILTHQTSLVRMRAGLVPPRLYPRATEEGDLQEQIYKVEADLGTAQKLLDLADALIVYVQGIDDQRAAKEAVAMVTGKRSK